MGKSHFRCSYWAHDLGDHASHPIDGSSMTLTRYFRYVVIIVFDGLAFEMWGRKGSYMIKLLKLHYIGRRKYVIEKRNLSNQTFDNELV